PVGSVGPGAGALLVQPRQFPAAGAGNPTGGRARRTAYRGCPGVGALPALSDLSADRAADALRNEDVVVRPRGGADGRRAGVVEPRRLIRAPVERFAPHLASPRPLGGKNL